MQTREERNRELEGYPDPTALSHRRTLDHHIRRLEKLIETLRASQGPDDGDVETLELAKGALAILEAAFPQDEACPNCGTTETLYYLWALPERQGGSNNRYRVCTNCGAVSYEGSRPIKSWCASSAPYCG